MIEHWKLQEYKRVIKTIILTQLHKKTKRHLTNDCLCRLAYWNIQLTKIMSKCM